MGELRTEFLTLVRQDAGTLAQRQRRGYDLEKLVTRL
ncbi:MAG: hypothetical protein QOC83_4304, partial [Pseudonocardiales bacterium]|nr:hypothetical protein [Pseudonocardiales bacterium]